MPLLPIPPAPRPTSDMERVPFAGPRPGPAVAVIVPRYFIEVKVRGYSIDKTVAHVRRQKQQAELPRSCSDRACPPAPKCDSTQL